MICIIKCPTSISPYKILRPPAGGEKSHRQTGWGIDGLVSSICQWIEYHYWFVTLLFSSRSTTKYHVVVFRDEQIEHHFVPCLREMVEDGGGLEVSGSTSLDKLNLAPGRCSPAAEQRRDVSIIYIYTGWPEWKHPGSKSATSRQQHKILRPNSQQ